MFSPDLSEVDENYHKAVAAAAKNKNYVQMIGPSK